MDKPLDIYARLAARRAARAHRRQFGNLSNGMWRLFLLSYESPTGYRKTGG